MLTRDLFPRFGPTVSLPSRVRWVIVIALVTGIVLGVTAGIAAQREPMRARFYACVIQGKIISFERERETACPGGTIVAYDGVPVRNRMQVVTGRVTSLARGQLTLADVMIAAALVMTAWVVAGRQIRDTRLLLGWWLIPVFSVVSMTCIIGPGHWFPKAPYEGRAVIPLGNSDAITVLDLVGLGVMVVTVTLSVVLIRVRMRR